MKKLLIASLLVFLCACSRSDSLPECYAIHISRQQGCAIIHIDPFCDKSDMTLMPASELYQTANEEHGLWTCRYNGSFRCHMRFCAKCISPAQMRAIIKSIDDTQQRLFSEDIDKMIDDLTAIKEEQLQIEKSIDFDFDLITGEKKRKHAGLLD